MDRNAICQFCLQKTFYNVFNDGVEAMMTAFFPSKDNNIQNSSICPVCFTNLESAYRFTQTANENNSKILDATLENDDEVCQTCLNPVTNPHVYLYDHTDNVAPFTAIQRMLSYCLITLDLGYRQNPIMCDVCWEVLKMSYRFLVRCAHTEEKITRFCKENGIITVCSEDLKKLSEYNVDVPRTCNDIILLDVCRNMMESRNGTRIEITTEDIFTEIKAQMEEQAISEVVKIENDSDSDVEQSQNDIPQSVSQFENPGLPMDIEHVKVEDNVGEYESEDVDQDPEEVVATSDSETTEECSDNRKLYVKLDRISFKGDSRGKQKPRSRRGTRERQEHKCHLCPYSTKKLCRINYHLTTHMTLEECAKENKLYECSKCSYRSKRKDGLTQHTRRIHRNSTYICQKCVYETNEGDSFQAHLKLKHDIHTGLPEIRWPEVISKSEKIILKCGYCEFETKASAALDEHALTHSNPRTQKLYKCEVCGYQVKKKSGITRHVVTHSTKKELSRRDNVYRCDQCSYVTKRKDCLVPHIRRHKMSKSVKKESSVKCEKKNERIFNLRSKK